MPLRPRFPIALAVAAILGVASAGVSTPQVEQFSRSMLDFVRATRHDCSAAVSEANSDREVTCAYFGQGFSAWKSEWETGMRRHDNPGKAKPGAAWELRSGAYRKEFLVKGSEVVVTFDENTHEVVIACELAETGADTETPRALAPAAPPEPEGPRIAGFDGVGTPVLIPDSRVHPEYPADARAARVEGSVILDLVILADGSVDDVRVLRGNPQGQGFEEAATAAVRQWRYRPATYRGQAVDVTFTVYVEFTLPPAEG